MEEVKINVEVGTDTAKEKFLEEIKKMKSKKNVVPALLFWSVVIGLAISKLILLSLL